MSGKYVMKKIKFCLLFVFTLFKLSGTYMIGMIDPCYVGKEKVVSRQALPFGFEVLVSSRVLVTT